MPNEVKIIYCPDCKIEVAKQDVKSKIDRHVKCKNCKKLVIYHVESRTVEVKPAPKRTCSSGMTFF